MLTNCVIGGSMPTASYGAEVFGMSTSSIRSLPASADVRLGHSKVMTNDRVFWSVMSEGSPKFIPSTRLAREWWIPLGPLLEPHDALSHSELANALADSAPLVFDLHGGKTYPLQHA